MSQIPQLPAERFDTVHRRARLIWLLILVGAPLLITGAIVMAITSGNLETHEPLVPPSMAYPILIGGCIVLLLAARGITGFVMHPERLAKLNLAQPGSSQPRSPESEAAVHVQNGTFIVLGILDLPIVAGLALAIMDWDIQFLLPVLVYGVLVSAFAMPDFTRIAVATAQAIHRRDGNG